MYLVEEVLFANCSHFADVVDKADGSLCGAVAFADSNVPEAIQELGPGVRSDPVSHGQSHLVIPVTVALEEGRRAPSAESYCPHAHVDVESTFTFGVLQRYRMISPMYCTTVTLYFLQSFQNWEVENFLLRTIVMPRKIECIGLIRDPVTPGGLVKSLSIVKRNLQSMANERLSVR